jgi:3-hydroxyacyl-CoA dehydrogenase
MGSGIAQLAGAGGARTLLYDPDPRRCNAASTTARGHQQARREGRLDGDADEIAGA